jgi:glycosyltransferase involved in cell wall biosynthesis
MKICIVTTAFPRWPGDAQGSFVWEAARAISRHSIAVRVVAMHVPGTRTYERMEDIEVFRPRYLRPERWEILRREGGGLPIVWQQHPWARALFLPFGVVHALAVARYGRDCDLVHANWTLSAAAARLGQPIHGRPIIATLQGSDVFQATRTAPGRRFARFALEQCEKITVLSTALARATIALGVAEDRVSIIPNGVDAGRFSPPRDGEREPVILYVGSFIERKGIRYLLSAAPDLLRILPGYRIELIGEGPQEPQLREMVRLSGVSDRVVFRGFLSQDEVRDAMQRARIFVLPSLEEGLGVVLLEALACGTPVVASDVGGIPDIVTRDVGALVPPADPSCLRDAIVRILRSPELWAEFSTNARARVVMSFDWDHIAQRFVTLYRSLT